jgi:hypothetical protein
MHAKTTGHDGNFRRRNIVRYADDVFFGKLFPTRCRLNLSSEPPHYDYLLPIRSYRLSTCRWVFWFRLCSSFSWVPCAANIITFPALTTSADIACRRVHTNCSPRRLVHVYVLCHFTSVISRFLSGHAILLLSALPPFLFSFLP